MAGGDVYEEEFAGDVFFSEAIGLLEELDVGGELEEVVGVFFLEEVFWFGEFI